MIRMLNKCITEPKLGAHFRLLFVIKIFLEDVLSTADVQYNYLKNPIINIYTHGQK